MRAWYLVAVLSLVAPLVLAGCASGRTSAGTPLPTVVLGAGDAPAPSPAQTNGPSRPAPAGVVVASAVVTPAERAAVSAGVAGRIATVHAVAGDRVAAGEPLVTLDDAAARAQLAQAQAALGAARANLDVVSAGATAEELRQAEAALAGTRAALATAQAGGRPEAVAQAEASLASARAALALVQRGATDLERQAAQLAVEQAQGARLAAQGARDATCGGPNEGSAQCAAAQGQVLVAEAQVRQAENALAQLRQGAAPETVTQAQQAVRAAEAQLALARQPATAQEIAAAQASVDAAQAALDALTAGARPERVAAAQAEVAQADAQVQAAEATLATLTIAAPVDGTVVDLDAFAGQWVIPGQPLATVADLEALMVETTDLSELDVPRVAVGQEVTVNVEALGVDAPGTVTAIAPLAEALGGDVVYRVTVDLREPPAGLRAGMSAEVRF